MNNKEKIWFGRTAYQVIPDRYYRDNSKGTTHSNSRKIGNRILKNWNDRMPNWMPDNNGEYQNDYFYGGNLNGITSKLSYIQEMGFNAIYLTPVEESCSYHHYDVGNHFKIDPWLGTWSDLKKLCHEANKLDIVVIADLVFNHTGIHSIYFENQNQYDWYKKDSNGNNIFWWDFKDMPEIDCMNKSYQDAMTNVVKKYLDCGVSGIRLDLGENLPKEFINAIGKLKYDFQDCIFIGEMWGFATDKEDSKITDGQLESIMNYPMADAILRWVRYGNFNHFSYTFNRILNEYPKNAQNLLLNNIGTHDTPTTLTMLVGDSMNEDIYKGRIWDIEGPWHTSDGKFNTFGFRQFEADNDKPSFEKYLLARNLAKVAISILYNIPGIPCIYYGTEIGETGYKDPFSRKPYNWYHQDSNLKKFVSKLGYYRKENSDILATGDASILRIDDSVLILRRSINSDDKIIIAVNRTANNVSINIDKELTSIKPVFRTNGSNVFTLVAYGIVIVRSN